MSLATFNPPIAATSIVDGLPRIILGMGSYGKEQSTSGTVLMFVAIATDGTVEQLDPTEFTFDFRWNGFDWVDPENGAADDDDEA